MKSVLILFLSVSCVYGLTSIPEFETLSPEKKVDTLLEEYVGDEEFAYKLDFARKVERISDERDKTVPYMLSLMRKYDAHPCESEQNEIELFDDIFFNFFQRDRLRRNELKELGRMYTDLLDRYLKTYKTVDAMALLLQVGLIKFTRRRYTLVNRDWVEKTYKRYVALGYDGLIINYEELSKIIDLDRQE